ncbi:hypothetical protein C8F01DRAFT_1085766 [Mycena amicta]|nr:hypothetical protein C8F01DRAFT_1085766 [Mycena amicta]
MRTTVEAKRRTEISERGNEGVASWQTVVVDVVFHKTVTLGGNEPGQEDRDEPEIVASSSTVSVQAPHAQEIALEGDRVSRCNTALEEMQLVGATLCVRQDTIEEHPISRTNEKGGVGCSVPSAAGTFVRSSIRYIPTINVRESLSYPKVALVARRL